MENDQLIENVENTPTKPSTFLIVLAVFSFLYISSSFFGSVSSYFTGPVSADQMEVMDTDMAKSITDLKNMGQDNFADMFSTYMKQIHYMNEKAFYFQNTVTLILALIGGLGVFFMIRKRKLGFHLYIIYSLLAVGSFYLVYPKDLILTVQIFLSLFFSALFIFLYGLNLKQMS